MRIKALLLVGIISASQALAQGTLTFSTTPTYVKPAGAAVTDQLSGALLTGATSWGQLYFSTTQNGTYTAFGTAKNFLTGGGAGFISGGTVLVPGVAEGASVWIQLRAWEGAAGSSYETTFSAAGKTGFSNSINVTLGGPGLTPPAPPATLNGLTGFAISGVPEPSTIALGLLGVAGMMIRRRK